MVFTVPGVGHLNPLWPILKEILKTGECEMIIFLDDENKAKVESIGASFRPVKNYEQYWKIGDAGDDLDLYKLLKCFYDLTIDNKENFISEIEKEEPDLIIYDFLCKPFVWTAHYYNHYYNLGKTLSPQSASKLKFCPKKPFPETVCFSPSINSVSKKLPIKVTLWTIIRIIFLQILFRLTLGF